MTVSEMFGSMLPQPQTIADWVEKELRRSFLDLSQIVDEANKEGGMFDIWLSKLTRVEQDKINSNPRLRRVWKYAVLKMIRAEYQSQCGKVQQFKVVSSNSAL